MCRKVRRFGAPRTALMLMHILVAAWRNLLVNRLASVLAIIGLAIGITAALVSGLVVRSQLSFNHFMDGYDRTYLAVSLLAAPGAPDSYDTRTNFQASPLLQLNLPGIEASTRLLDETGKVQHGDRVNEENIGWADPSLFKVLPMPVIRGDASGTLGRPDGLVMTASMARKYFGRSGALGESLVVNGHPMILGAVLADFPPGETHLQGGIFASGLAAHSPMARLKPDGPQGFSVNVQTYVRLQSRADAAGLARNVEAVTRRFLPPIFKRIGISYSMPLVRIDQIHLWEPLAPGAQARLALAGLIGFLILLIAVANYVNLVLASVPRRAREIALRKVNGAGRRHILLQFLGEAMLCVLAAACLAFGVSEPLLHFVNAFMSEGEAPGFWSHPAQLGLVLPGLLLAAIVAAAYPATVISAIRPATILRKVRLAESTLLRNVLVAGQFSILIVLLIGASVVYLQNSYASRHDLHVAANGMLVIPGRCPNAFRQEAARLPGVEGVACSGVDFLEGRGFGPLRVHGQTIATRFVSAEFGIFGLYGLSPLAGSLGPFPLQDAKAPTTYVAINATAARRFGFGSPAGAVGQFINLDFERQIATGADRGCGPGFPVLYRLNGRAADDLHEQPDGRARRRHRQYPSAQTEHAGDAGGPGAIVDPNRKQGAERALFSLGPPKRPLPADPARGRIICDVRRRRDHPGLHGPGRDCRLRRTAPHQGNRHPQGVRRQERADREAAVVAVRPPGSSCQSCCMACRAVVDSALAGGLCLSH